jgi:hypothetical protein
MPMSDFISEDDLETFEGWLRYQGVDPDSPPEHLAQWRAIYDDALRSPSPKKVGLMKLRSLPGEYLYAVAVREDSGLWLALWVRRSVDQVFALMPGGDPKADVHASYHRDGSVHMKSNGRKFHVRKLQPLAGAFQNTEHLGTFAGYGPKKVGAVCDHAAFDGILDLPPGILGPRDGAVIVDLVAPGCEPIWWPATVIRQETFKHAVPWIVIRVVHNDLMNAA